MQTTEEMLRYLLKQQFPHLTNEQIERKRVCDKQKAIQNLTKPVFDNLPIYQDLKDTVKNLMFLKENKKKSLLGMVYTEPKAVLHYLCTYNAEDEKMKNYVHPINKFCQENFCYKLENNLTKRNNRISFKKTMQDDKVLEIKIIFGMKNFFQVFTSQNVEEAFVNDLKLPIKKQFTGIDDLLFQLKKTFNIS